MVHRKYSQVLMDEVKIEFIRIQGWKVGGEKVEPEK